MACCLSNPFTGIRLPERALGQVCWNSVREWYNELIRIYLPGLDESRFCFGSRLGGLEILVASFIPKLLSLDIYLLTTNFCKRCLFLARNIIREESEKLNHLNLESYR